MKRPKKLHKQSSKKTKATKVNSIMDQLDNLYGNIHERNTNINHFVRLFESDNGKGNRHKTKPKTPIIVLSEVKEGDGGRRKTEGNEEDTYDQKKKTTAKIYDPDSDVELNRDFDIAEYDDNSNNDK